MTETSNNKTSERHVQSGTHSNRKKLGEILVENGVLTALTVERMLKLAGRAGKRFGTILEEMELITGEELAQALATQYGYRTVSNFAQYHYPDSLLKLVPVETAVEHTVFPLKVQDSKMAIAMIDPTNQKLLDNLKHNNHMLIHPFIATRKDINEAISKHYLKQNIEEEENTILVVEDDKIILNTLTIILRREGYRVVTAGDGMEAFKQIITTKPRLILTDKEMPKFDGYALLDSLRHIPETKMIPVILISETANPDEEAIAYEKGFFDFVSKPVKEVTLKAKVKRALKSHSHLLPVY